MAILDNAPTQVIIDGFKGVLDFYQWRGLWCVRKWPVYKPRIPHVTESLNQQSFAYINKLWRTIPSFVQNLYRAMAVGTPFTGKDLYVIAYMGGLDYTQE